MSPESSAGRRLRDAIAIARAAGAPLHMVGVADGSDALEAQRAGFRALYVSGSQVAASRGWADIGRLDLGHVLEHVRRILDSGTALPILVDGDTGFHDVAETVRALEAIGAAGVHVEDQEDLKMCGHLDGKHVVPRTAAAARIARAAGAKRDPAFAVMARTDALAVEGMDGALDRIRAYADAGADMVFPEGFPDPGSYRPVKEAAGGRPVLANMTEFGKVALMTPSELDTWSGGAVDLVLNPLTVYRAQRRTAARMYRLLHERGTQRGQETDLQERRDFQQLIDYERQVAERSAELAAAPPEGSGAR